MVMMYGGVEIEALSIVLVISVSRSMGGSSWSMVESGGVVVHLPSGDGG